MKPTPTPPIDAEVVRLAAREQTLRLLALAASDPLSRRFEKVLDPVTQEIACAAADHIAGDPRFTPVEFAPGESPVRDLDLRPLCEALRAPRQRILEDHTRVFGLVAPRECPPLEIEYCPQTFAVYRSQRLADVAGFYRAFGVRPGRDVPERPDHIACELEFLAWVSSKERHARLQEGDEWRERAEVCRDAQRRFTDEHFAWWVPAFARGLRERAASLSPPAPVQAALATVLAALVPAERAFLEIAPPAVLARPRVEPVERESACAGCTAGAPLATDEPR